MSGAELIAAERQRQIDVEGWTPGHDAGHSEDQLAIAAACYAMPEDTRMDFGLEEWWPWAHSWWEPGDRVRELVKAGALIAAEIDRLAGETGDAT